MTVIKNKGILKCLLMMVVSLLLVLGVSIGVSASSGYDRQEADVCITISGRLSVKGGSKYVKASLWERIRTKTAKVGDINPNPLDEFSNFKIGPNESAVSRYIKEINTNGTISEPIEVQKLSSGGYEIVNGHHRWLAAIKTGLKEVPIKIVNYEN